MSGREEYEKTMAKLRSEVEELKKTVPEADLKKRFFKNFGCVNFKSAEFFHELGCANVFHEEQMKLHSEEHEVKEYDRWTCYHVTECKCGFSHACDSSD